MRNVIVPGDIIAFQDDSATMLVLQNDLERVSLTVFVDSGDQYLLNEKWLQYCTHISAKTRGSVVQHDSVVTKPKDNGEKTMTDISSIDSITQLDRIIAETQARQEAKGGGRGKRLSDEQKAARIAETERQKAERKAAREARKAERDAQPRQTKLDKVREALPGLTDSAAAAFLACGSLTLGELEDLMQHISFKVRSESVEASKGKQFEEGALVRVLVGKHDGEEATVTKPGRVRCHVKLDSGKDLYLFNNELEAV